MTTSRFHSARPTKQPYQSTKMTYSAIVDHLRKTYKPRCLQPGEDRDKALHYAGKVELAQWIISQLDPEEHEEEL